MNDHQETFNYKKAVWLGSTQLAPIPAVLVACGGVDGKKPNLMTAAWAGIACSKPPMLSVAIQPERHSYGIIKATGEFSINLPSAPMAQVVDWCGVVSGRDHDKFGESGLTPAPGTKISAPIVAECPLALECKVSQILELGSHHLFIADILAVQVTEALLDATGRLDLERYGLLAFVHGHYYNIGKCLGHFGFSVRKKPGSTVRR